jgi:hypothetical protein
MSITGKLLVIAAVSAAVGFSVSAANAAPAMNMLETLKASAAEATLVQEARHRHRRGYRHARRQNCWWGDRWLCRYLW